MPKNDHHNLSSKGLELVNDDQNPSGKGLDLVEDLRAQLSKAQAASEEYQAQLAVLQRQLNEALNNQEILRARVDADAEELKAFRNRESKEEIEVVTTANESQIHPIGNDAHANLSGESQSELASQVDQRDPKLDMVQISKESDTTVSQDGKEKIHNLEQEVLSLKDQNNALTLYVNRIINRLLEQDKFEEMFEDGTITGSNPLSAANNVTANVRGASYSLPSADYSKETPDTTMTPTILQRAGSFFSSSQPRPDLSTSAPSTDTAIHSPAPFHINENPNTAISIPLRQPNIVRRPKTRVGDDSLSMTSSRHSSRQHSPNSQRRLSGAGIHGPTTTISKEGLDSLQNISSSASDSGYNEEISSTTRPSDHRTISGSSEPLTTTPPRSIPGTGRVFNASGSGGSNHIRPLRLVQEQTDSDEAAQRGQNKSKRSSWVGGWFSGGKGSTDATTHVGGMDGGSHTTSEMAPPPVPPRRPQRTTPPQSSWAGVGLAIVQESSPRLPVQNQWPGSPHFGSSRSDSGKGS